MDFDEIQSEEMVLGIILKHGERIFEINGKLKPHMFSSRINALIYKTMVSLSKKGNNANLILVLGSLEDRGKLDDVGGKDYVEHLFGKAGDVVDVTAYSDRIRDAFNRGNLI